MKLEIRYPKLPLAFYRDKRDLLQEIDSICSGFFKKGYTLTLRQLYYQLVSRNRIPNTEKSYTNLGNIVRDGRYAGVVDWEYLTDRVRLIRDAERWQDSEDHLVQAAEDHRIDTWAGQRYRPEVWIEKDALLEIAHNPCNLLDVQYMSVKAYSSVSALWEARKRFRDYVRQGQIPVILHLGDHDATGDDCSRFLKERMELMVNTRALAPGLDVPATVEVRRLALNIDQIERYELRPQPGKTADPRFKGYRKKHGTTDAWELDALAPDVIERIIEDGIRAVMDEDVRRGLVADQEEQRTALSQIGQKYHDVREFLEIISNGQRASYQAWKHFSDFGDNCLKNGGITPNLGIPKFHRPAPPVSTERDAQIAEEYAAALAGGAMQEVKQ